MLVIMGSKFLIFGLQQNIDYKHKSDSIPENAELGALSDRTHFLFEQFEMTN